MSSLPCLPTEVILGVDTHRDTHAAALVDELGRFIAAETFPVTRRGIRALIAWAQNLGAVRRAGVEGTGSYGAGLTRALQGENIEVIEVTRAARVGRRHLGKNDPRDAEAAARSVLAGQASAAPKSRDGTVEAIRVLRNARASAVKARTQAIIHLKSLIITAPDQLREPLSGLTNRQLVGRCARMRRGEHLDATGATKIAMRTLARRHQNLDHEIAELQAQITTLITKAAPRLLAEPGIGPEIAARLLILAGDNPHRIRNDSALAALCGASPVEASSGKTTRHRLNRGGDRQANSALWLIANNRMLHHAPTRDYVTRRTQQGKTTREIRRCLMRHIARGIHPLLIADLTNNTQPLLT